jgi:heme-degrading monooxygenase HmoA
MAYVRVVSFSLPREEADSIAPGSDAYNALVSGRKFLAQGINGLIQTAVWRSNNPTGRVAFMIMSEWSDLDDLNYYANHPTIQKLENVISTGNDTFAVQVFEMLG